MAPGVLGYASDINTQDLLRYTNERRAKVGLKPLKLNNTLSLAAERKASDMFDVGYWAHVSPMGTKPWDFILSEGYDYIYAGENLAKNFSNSEDVVDAWYESPSHRDNLLSPNYDDIGFAIVNGVLDGYETTLVVQMFGRSRQPAYLASGEDLVNSGEETVYEPETLTEVDIPPQVEGEQEPTPVIVQQEELAFVSQSKDQSEQPLLDVKTVTRSITITFGGFITTLLGIDIWYSKKHGILKLTGHTLAHLIFLIVVLGSVMISVFPGAIL
jgi:hypothetical protein